MIMMTLQEAWELAESINETAHDQSWDSWTAADAVEETYDEEEDAVSAEELREDASEEQASYFRDGFYDLEEEQQQGLRHWIENDEDFRDQFETWFGWEEFEREFGANDADLD
jgi:hypothetical protein